MEPEPFDPSEFESLAGAVPWVRRVLCLPEVDSTNAEALRLARDEASDGIVVVADAQSAGRGRLGRSWWSEPGTALLVSWLLRPTLSLERWPLLTLVAGVAAARAASASSGIEVRLKWPNDLVIESRKLGGILAESDAHGALVVGVGINVRQDRFPDELGDGVTSIVAAGGRPPARAWLLAAVLSGFGARMAEPEGALEEYRLLCDTLGRSVRVERTNSPPLEGTAVDVGKSGTLVVDTGSDLAHVAAGDVVHLRPGEKKEGDLR